MKASYLFKKNIETLLKARGLTKHDLAFYCRRSDAWIVKILGKDDRNLPMKYLDRIADFFGLAAYQLFQPGISPLTERRKRERRSGQDRRISARNRDLPKTPIRQIDLTPEDEALLAELHSLTHAEYEHVKHWVQVQKLGRSNGPSATTPVDPSPAVTSPAARSPRTRAETRK